jgi:integrase
VRHIHRTLSLIMDLAVKDWRISRNPAKSVKLPRLPKIEKRFLTRDEFVRPADAAALYRLPEVGEQYRALILVLAFCGLRWGEAAGLKVGRVGR